MAEAITIEIQGMDKLKRKFGRIPANVTTEVDGAMYAVANEFVNRAVNDAPVDQGLLRNEITFEKIGLLNYNIISGASYSAYVEFGTRGRVEVPIEIAGYASQFKGAGISGNAKQMVFDWCKRKGIDQKYWFQIFISIMANGIHPHPFFFKQLPIARQEINELSAVAIKTALEK